MPVFRKQAVRVESTRTRHRNHAQPPISTHMLCGPRLLRRCSLVAETAGLAEALTALEVVAHARSTLAAAAATATAAAAPCTAILLAAWKRGVP